jgi:hypothetical protein
MVQDPAVAAIPTTIAPLHRSLCDGEILGFAGNLNSYDGLRSGARPNNETT